MVLSFILSTIQFPSLPQAAPSDLIAFGLPALFPVYQTSYLSNDYKLSQKHNSACAFGSLS